MLSNCCKNTRSFSRNAYDPKMSIKKTSMFPSRLSNLQTAKQADNIFKASYRVDLKKMGALNVRHFKVDKIGLLITPM